MPALVKRILLRGAALLALVALSALGAWSLLRNPVEYTPQERPHPPAESHNPSITSVPPPRPSDAFLGSRVCAECHEEIAQLYASNPMAHSTARVSEAAPVEDVTNAEFLIPPSTHGNLRVRYYVEQAADGVYHHETAFVPGGEDVYDQRVPVHFEVGSGKRGRSYITNRDGLLFMSPISWYSEKGRWDLSPGYSTNNQHFERRIRDGCLTCHVGRMAPVDGRQDCYESEPVIEGAIGCERCHGPGKEHVAFHTDTHAPDAVDPIVNPLELKPSQRDAVCYQCHLVGEERIPRFGRSDFDFRPGDDIIDIWTIFVLGTGISTDQSTEAVSQVEQMRSSACFLKGDGRLGCVSCHDPHANPTADSRVTFYRQRCLNCHAADDPECSLALERRLEVTAEDSCIDCHMPRIAANDIPHTSQTDHRVLQTYEGESDDIGNRRPPLKIFDDEALPPAERDRAVGMMMVVQAERNGKLRILATDAIRKLEAWVAAVPDDQDAAEMLGAAYLLTRDVDAACNVWKQVLEQNPDNESVLRRLVVTCHENDRPDEGVGYARRLIALNPWNDMYHGRLAHMLAQRGEFDEAIREGERAAELMPSDYWVQGWLAEAYRLAGQPERAAAHELARDLLAPRVRP